MLRKVLRPISGLLLAALVAALVVGTATPATAHYPLIEAATWCDAEGRPWIDFRTWSWKQDPSDDARSGNPDIGIYVEGLQVDQGAFTAENGYEFSGSILATKWEGATVTLRAQADAPFNNGSSLGSSRETSVHVPADCLPEGPKMVSVSVTVGACRFEDAVSRTPVEVSIEPGGAAVLSVTDGSGQVVALFEEDGSFQVTPGRYSWVANPEEAYELKGPSSGEFRARECEPRKRSETDLSVSKASPVGSVLKGELVRYVIEVTNHGPRSEPNAIAVDTLPDTFDLESVAPSQGSCGVTGRVVTCELGPLAVGDTATIVLVVETSVVGRYQNEVVVDGDVPDDNPANNQDTEDTDVFDVLPTTVIAATTSSTMPPTTPPSTPAGPSGTEVLPFTGSADGSSAGIGIASVALGALVLLVAARREEAPAAVWIGVTWRSGRPRNTINLLGPRLDV